MTNPLAMSDEDFLKEAPPVVEEASSTSVVLNNDETTVVVEDDNTEALETDVDNKTLDETAPSDSQESDNSTQSKDLTNVDTSGKSEAALDSKNVSDASEPNASKSEESKSSNYQEMYDNLLAPFQANGKTIKLQTPEEARQLMQMGANYTRKMQAIAPHRKILMMLENNNLLSEEKLAYLIDLDKKDPGAISKLVKDSGIDPMDIDTNQDSGYKAGNHVVSDSEANFRTALEEMNSSDDGKSMLQSINSSWDDQSKAVLYQSPELFDIFRQQKASGVYALISEDIDRRRTLGNIPLNLPFIEAYKLVGDELTRTNGFSSLNSQGNTSKAVPVAVRTVAPKNALVENTRANAASTTRASPRKAEVFVNPLAMSDEDFMKLPNKY